MAYYVVVMIQRPYFLDPAPKVVLTTRNATHSVSYSLTHREKSAGVKVCMLPGRTHLIATVYWAGKESPMTDIQIIKVLVRGSCVPALEAEHSGELSQYLS
jgi:hypothetical protein